MSAAKNFMHPDTEHLCCIDLTNHVSCLVNRIIDNSTSHEEMAFQLERTFFYTFGSQNCVSMLATKGADNSEDFREILHQCFETYGSVVDIDKKCLCLIWRVVVGTNFF